MKPEFVRLSDVDFRLSVTCVAHFFRDDTGVWFQILGLNGLKGPYENKTGALAAAEELLGRYGRRQLGNGLEAHQHPRYISQVDVMSLGPREENLELGSADVQK